MPTIYTNPWDAQDAFFEAQRQAAQARADQERLDAERRAQEAAAAQAAAAAAPAAGQSNGQAPTDTGAVPGTQNAPAQAAGPGTAPAEPSPFEAFLAGQQDIPGINSLAAWLKAPQYIRQRLLDKGTSAHAEQLGLDPANTRALKQAANEKYNKLVTDRGVLGESKGFVKFYNAAEDIAASAASGAIGAFKSITDLAGNDNFASRFLGKMQKVAEQGRSEESQRTQAWIDGKIKEAADNGHTMDAIGAWVDGALKRPGETLANLAGSFATLGLGKAAQGVALARGASAAGAAKVATGAMVGTGAAQGAGATRQQIYDQTLEDARRAGKSEQEAAVLAENAARLGNAAGSLALAAVIGGAAGGTGVDKLALGGGARGTLGRVGQALAEPITEGAQSLQQVAAGNLAANQAGVRTGDILDANAMSQGAIGAIQGAIAGGAVAGAQQMAARNAQPAAAASGPVVAPPGPQVLPTAQPVSQAAADLAAQAQGASVRTPKPGEPMRAEDVPVPDEFTLREELDAFAPALTPGQKEAVDQLFYDNGGVTRTQIEELGIQLQPTTRMVPVPAVEEVAPPIEQASAIANEATAALLSEPLRNGLASGETKFARQALADISLDPGANEVERTLAKWLGERVGDTTISLGDLGDAGQHATFNLDSRHITLDNLGGQTRHAVLHEAAHAVTLDAMRASPDTLDVNQRAARDDVSAIRQAFLANNPAAQGLYAIPNDVEFVAQALSDRTLQDELRAMEWAPRKSIWGQLVQTLRSVVGLPETDLSNTAWAALLDAADTLALPAKALTGTDTITGDTVPLTAGSAPDGKDTMFARMDSDGKGFVRGMATYDAATGKWAGIWHQPNGTVVRNNNLADIGIAKKWLEGKAKNANVVAYQARTGQVGALNKLKTDLEAISPGAASFMRAMDRITRGKLDPATLLDITKQAGSLWRWGASRFAPLNTLAGQLVDAKQALAVGESAMLMRRAQARSERTARGIAGDHWFDIKANTVQAWAGMRAAGVADGIVSDFAYAHAAEQANRVRSREFPSDLAGRAKLGDFAKFSYYADASGRIIDVPDGAKPPPGAVHVTGDTAPAKFKAQFRVQFPGAITAGDKLLSTVRQGNLHVLKLLQANGAISLDDFRAMRSMDLYLPMRQTEKASKARGPNATGRSTKADNPVAQWMAVGDARVDLAYEKGILQALANALTLDPNPQIAMLNSVSAKLAPSVLNPALSEVELRRADWDGEFTVGVWQGNRRVNISFNEGLSADVAKALKGNDTEAMPRVMNGLRATTRWLSFVRTGLSPAFMAGQLAWDAFTAVTNVQGAFKGVNRSSDISNGQAARMALAILPTAATNLRAAWARSREVTTRKPSSYTPSLLRKFYDANGGGIHIDARGDYTLQRNMLLNRGAGAQAMDASMQAVHFMNTMGHTVSDAIRFTAFEQYMTMRNGGKPFTSDAQLRQFAASNPDAVQAALMGSKNLLTNFERAGQGTVLRAVLPFFNAGVQGTTDTMVRILGTPHGWKSMSILAGVGLLGALAEMGTDDDKTADGYSKRLDSDNAWKTLNLFGVNAPLPPELQFMAWAVNGMAAFITRADGHEVDTHRLASEAWGRIKDLSPLRLAPFEDAPVSTAFGIFSPLLMAIDGRDQFGRPLVADPIRGSDGKRIVLPDHQRGRGNDPAWLSDVAEGFAAIGIDVAPGTYKLWFDNFAGSASQMLAKYRKGEEMAAMGQDTSGLGELGAWMFNKYTLQPNDYAPRDRVDAAMAGIPAKLTRNEEGLTMAQLMNRAFAARKAGDFAGEEEARAAMKALRAQITEAALPLRDPGARGQSLLQ